MVNILVVIPLLAVCFFGGFAAYLAGFKAGRRAVEREWLEALMTDFDDAGTLAEILRRIEDDARA